MPRGFRSGGLAATAAVLVVLSLGGARADGLPAGEPEALQSSGVPGSPDAGRMVDGRFLPNPPPPFAGRIDLNALQSQPAWPPRLVPPKGAPNILLIMTDDVGFAAPSTFGGVIPTPALDRIADQGLRYTNFHSTALCSPTRAALITGRNHHSVGFGVVAEQSTGFPGYNSTIGPENATIGRILLENGYRTAWFGKNHNTPDYAQSQAGPFDQWPTGMGFSYFYGFNGGDTSQWQPNLFRNTTQIYPFQDHPRWNLITAMADDAIDWLNQLNDLDPALPFFVYYVPGGTHAPHHPTPEWIDRIHALHLFDDGWNALRDTIFANQKRLGVIPATAELTPWPDGLLARWSALTDDDRRLFIRQAEVYAAYLAYTDHEIGRVIQAVEDLGKLDDTLIIYISGDNGASAEGTPTGTPNEMLVFNGIDLPVAKQMPFFDAWGSAETYPHFAVPWAWAFDTPFRWTKQIAAYFGGTRQGMAVSWPRVIKDKGGIRNQFAHVIDVVPTLLEATGIAAPDFVDGIAQKPIEGTSFAYTFDAAMADAPGRHRTQYFEMFGMRALYHDGWMLSTVPINLPWNLAGPAIPNPAEAFAWELFDVTQDWTQAHDVAAANPAKLREMQDRLWTELASHQALPLDSSVATRVVAPRPSMTAGRDVFRYSGRPVVGIPRSAAPNLLNTSYTITADITVPEDGGSGVVVTQGGRFGGFGLYLLAGRPVFLWNLLGLSAVRWESDAPLAAGHHTLVFAFDYDGLGFATLAYNDTSGIGRGGVGRLSIDGQVVAEHRLERTIPLLLPIDESLDIGSDTLTPVSGDYAVPFPFTGAIDGLTIGLDPPQLTDEQRAKLEEALAASIRKSAD